MLLNKIVLKDFRQYFGSVTINFSVDPIKNVTLIHAENGVGKTALLNAIKWCFYGSFTSNFRNPKSLISFEAVKEDRNKCSVEIEFVEQEETYLLQRVHTKGVAKTELKLFKLEMGTWGPSLDEPDLIINSFLPKEMADYFFFQGEGSNAVESGNKGASLGLSIRNILGFKVAESTIALLTKEIASIRRNIAQHDTSGAAQRLTEELEFLEKDLSIKKISLINSKETLPVLKDKFNSADKELDRINNINLQELKRAERELAQEYKKNESQFNTANRLKYEHIAKFGWAIYGNDFADESLDFIDESTLKGKLPEPYNKSFVKDLLESAECICGTVLEPGCKGYQKIVSMLDKAANPMLLQRLTGIRAQIQVISSLNEHANDVISNNISSCADYEHKMDTIAAKLKNIREDIEKIPEKEIQILQLQKNKLSKDIEEQNRLIGGYQNQIERITKQIAQKNTELLKATPDNKLIEAFNIKKEFIENINEYLSKHLEELELSVREHILDKVNSILNDFSRHTYSILVSEEDFNIALIDRDGNNVGQGDGLNLLLNLTITAALIEFVAQRQGFKDPLISTSSVAPLVIDAPFGVLDDSYRNVVIEQLPNRVQQVMFFVSTSQWKADMHHVAKEKVGAQYCLILEEAAEQGSRKLDKFNINGQEIIASRYGCERNRVFALEVE